MIHRKPTRLKNYDYTTNNHYFITICTHQHQCILSKISYIVGKSSQNEAVLKLSKLGEIDEKSLKNLNNKYRCINIKEYIIMPNHIHFIMEKHNGKPPPLQLVLLNQ